MTPTSWKHRGAALAVVLVTGAGLAACGSGNGGSGITLPSLSTTTTEASSTTTEASTTTSRETTTTPPTTQAGSTSTTSGGSTTTSDPATTTTTAPTTTTTAPTTTTTRATTTTSRETTTTTAESGTTVAPTTTIDGGSTGDDSGVSPWIWVLVAALVLLAILVGVLATVRSRKGAATRWNWDARDLARRSGDAARTLEQAAAQLGAPTASRQVWLDSAENLNTLAASAAALVPNAPKVPGDPEGANTLATALESLRSDLTVLRSAAVEAERTRFELVGPTTEQLNFATRSVEQAAAAVGSDAHAVAAAVDRVDPPTPQSPPR